jgi:phage terminase small subunit
MQEAFCREYLINPNGAEAAIKAGYEPNTAAQSAYKLLQSNKVKERLAELSAERIARTEITADFVLKELFRIASVDIGEAFDDKGNLKPLKEIPQDIRRAMQSIEVDELFDGFGQDRQQIGVTKKIKFWDKPKALELLGKHFKLYTDKVEHSGAVTLEALVTASRKEDE